MISLILPCYNEEKGLPKTLSRVPKIVDEVVISIDRKTNDNSAKIARKFKASVVEDKNSDGYGSTILSGIKMAKGDIIVTADGDATYPIEEIPKVISFLKKNKLDFVSCSRFPIINSESMKPINYLGNVIVSFIMSLLWNYKFKDGLSGMWVFKKKAFNKMTLISKGWNLSEEIKVEAVANKGIRFAEFHINYKEREGISKLPRLRVGIENILFLFKKKYLQLIPS